MHEASTWEFPSYPQLKHYKLFQIFYDDDKWIWKHTSVF